MPVKIMAIVVWSIRILAALILLQTLFFKFTAAPESVYIFSKLGMEPWGRIATGILELVASILILYPRTTSFGALLALGLMGGAIFFHLTTLGIDVLKDGGQLFVYALLVFACSLAMLIIYRQQVYSFLKLKPAYRL